MKTVQTIIGKVKKNKGRGQKFKYPTANVDVADETPDGIFLGNAQIGQKRYPALIFVGISPTFRGSKRQAEAHILDFAGDLVGLEIRLELKEKIREARNFHSNEEFSRQLKQDEKIARIYFGA